MAGQLSFETSMALFATMLVLAAIPGASVLTVSARAAAAGMRHGLAATLGIIAGDVFFIVLAVYGLALLAHTLGDSFIVVRYLGAAWLIWLGIMLWRSTPGAREDTARTDMSLWSSFLAGLFITLGDQKAVLFYLGFFPALFDLSRFSTLEALGVVVIAASAILIAKLAWAWPAARVGRLAAGGRIAGLLNRLAAGIMFIVALVLLAGG